MKRQVSGKKVFVGMSGGVDSSVSAALLQKAGYDVTGVFIRVWQPEWFECTWKEDRLDAMRVCAKLGIPFRDLDLSKEYKKEVVDYMIAEYKAGRTPNPDVMCNKTIKFGGFFDFAIGEGADFIATGHYARTKDGRLISSADTNKDQTYFLWTLTQEHLRRTLFPVGGMTKPEVRNLAEKYGLPTAAKKDSQGLCFIGKIDVTDFLSHYIKPKKGGVLNEAGKVIGTHDGAFFFTLGERHGFTITDKHPHDRPYFIVAKDVRKNTVTVSDSYKVSPEKYGVREVRISRTNWIPDAPERGHSYLARVRHRGPLEPCTVAVSRGKCALVSFNTPKAGISAGQSLVVYTREGECLGGGIIS